MNLTTNLIDIWPKYENSDTTVKFGDRVTLAKDNLEVTGELVEIAFYVFKSAKGSDSFAWNFTASVADADGNDTTLDNPVFYLEEVES